MRRSVEGATTADMAFIAQQAALDYERSLTETEEEEVSEGPLCPLNGNYYLRFNRAATQTQFGCSTSNGL